MKLIPNSLGRLVPEELDGKKLKLFQGAFTDNGGGHRYGGLIPAAKKDGNKLVKSLNEAIDLCNIKDGMTISFHHHLRDGDFIVNMVMERLAARGLRDLVLAPTALFPVHAPLVQHIESGVISHIEGSMNGPVGRACSLGKMKKIARLRSHGGRYRAIADGDLHIDVAFIAAPTADPLGNCNGVNGKSACGPLGFALADSLYADKVVAITDNLVPFPAIPFSLSGANVDYVVEVPSIGDNTKIVSGTTRLTKSPTQLLIAKYVMEFLLRSGIIREGWSFQAGAGGASLAVVKHLKEYMLEKNIHASFVRGGSTSPLVELLEMGLTGAILDGQCFDAKCVYSLRDNPRHIETNPYISYNYHTKGCIANMIDVVFLGGTEMDLDFHCNVNTHSDGWLLHGIGGHTDCAAGAGITMIVAPLFRKRFPIVVDRVVTVTAPGETIDVLVTERGVAINPRRQDLIEAMKDSSIPVKTIQELHDIALSFTGQPDPPKLGEKIVALVEYRDGTIIDSVREVLL